MIATLLLACLALLQPAAASLDDVLLAMDRAGDQLTTLQADITMTEENLALGDRVVRTGDVALQSGEETKFRATFNKKQIDSRIFDERVEYVLDGRWLTDRTYNQKIEVRREVLREGEWMELFKLGEGPFPLPIGQDPAEVRRLFDAELIDLDPDTAPQNTLHLRLSPRAGTSFAEQFTQIDVWVDPSDGMPRRIETFDVDGTSVRTTDFSNLRLNDNLPADTFALAPVGDDWNATVEPMRQP